MPKPPVNPFARFERAPTEYRHRLVAVSSGEVGTGKTTFWLGAPAPIVIQTMDQGLEGVVEEFASDKEIYVANYDMGIEPGAEYTHEMAVAARDKFIVDFETALPIARTIVWDRESDVWPLFCFAEWGTPDAFGAAAAKDWDFLKGKIRRLIAMAKASDINFGIIQGMRNEWKQTVNPKNGNKTALPTGRRIPSGMDDIDALVHLTIHHEREDGELTLTVGKSRGPGGHAVQDQTFPAIGFVELAKKIFPGTTDADWE
jgi:hypothetical protein